MLGIGSSIQMLAIGGIITVAGAGYWYYTESQKRIDALQHQVAQSDAAIQIQSEFITKQSEVIGNINDNMTLLQDVQSNLVKSSRENAAEVNTLRNKFNVSSSGKERDLGVLAAAKPALISKIVNKATKALGADVRELTTEVVIEDIVVTEEAVAE